MVSPLLQLTVKVLRLHEASDSGNFVHLERHVGQTNGQTQLILLVNHVWVTPGRLAATGPGGGTVLQVLKVGR